MCLQWRRNSRTCHRRCYIRRLWRRRCYSRCYDKLSEQPLIETISIRTAFGTGREVKTELRIAATARARNNALIKKKTSFGACHENLVGRNRHFNKSRVPPASCLI